MEERTNFLKHSSYYNGVLHNDPKPLPNQKEAVCCFYKKFGSNKPLMSIVIPIYNQEAILKKNLESIVKFTGGLYEMILILDDCEDKSEEIVLEWATTVFSENLTSITVIKSFSPLFETACDNIGFRLAEAPYCLEIQADMEMAEPNYNLTLLKPFEKFSDVIGVSGRCSTDFLTSDGFGKVGLEVTRSLDRAVYFNNLFYSYETCNRGPLLLDTQKLKELGYLDEKNFYLDNSDHDLFARAFYTKEWRCGYVPIEFISPLEDGSTRKPRNPKNTQALEERKQRSNGGFIQRVYDIKRAPDILEFLNQPWVKELTKLLIENEKLAFDVKDKLIGKILRPIGP